jgi:hypothetical protein
VILASPPTVRLFDPERVTELLNVAAPSTFNVESKSTAP